MLALVTWDSRPLVHSHSLGRRGHCQSTLVSFMDEGTICGSPRIKCRRLRRKARWVLAEGRAGFSGQQVERGRSGGDAYSPRPVSSMEHHLLECGCGHPLSTSQSLVRAPGREGPCRGKFHVLIWGGGRESLVRVRNAGSAVLMVAGSRLTAGVATADGVTGQPTRGRLRGPSWPSKREQARIAGLWDWNPSSQLFAPCAEWRTCVSSGKSETSARKTDGSHERDLPIFKISEETRSHKARLASI